MGLSLEGLDLKKEIKELKPTSRCFKDYMNSLKKTGNCEPATVNGYFLLLVRQRTWGEYDRHGKIIRAYTTGRGYAVERENDWPKKTNMTCLTNFLVSYGRPAIRHIGQNE